MVRYLNELVVALLLVISWSVFEVQGASAQEGKLSEELFQNEKLLDVQIQIPQKDWDSLRQQVRNFAESFGRGELKSPYSYFVAKLSVNGVSLGEVEIRKKGFFGSMDANRPSLVCKILNENAIRLVGCDRLILNNNKQDLTTASQSISYKLFRDAGLPAPRCSLAALTVNGENLGVYTNVEPIRSPFLKREFGNGDGVLYEGTFPTDFVANALDRFELDNGKEPSKQESLKKITQILGSEKEVVTAELQEFIDIDQFIDYWTMEVVIAFWDGYSSNQNNFYMYQVPADKKYRFIPWGPDAAFSNFMPFGPTSLKAKGLLAYRLYQDPAIREKYVASLREKFEKVWDEEKLHSEIDRLSSLSRPKLHALQQANFDQNIATLKQFISKHKETVLKEIENGPLPVPQPPGPLMYVKDIGKITGTFSGKWSDQLGAASADVGTGELSLSIRGEKIALSKVGVGGEPLPPFPMPGSPPPQGDKFPPSIVLVLSPEKEGSPYRVTIGLTDETFVAGAKAQDVQAFVMQGNFGMPGGGFFMSSGKLTLDSAEKTPDGKVSGKIELNLFEFKNGFGR